MKSVLVPNFLSNPDEFGVPNRKRRAPAPILNPRILTPTERMKFMPVFAARRILPERVGERLNRALGRSAGYGSWVE